MHNHKYKCGACCGTMAEANRTLYMDEEGNFIKDMPHSDIDFERTPYNYNLSENDYTREKIIALNEQWRGCKINEQKDNLFCGIDITLPQKFEIPGHPTFKYLVGKERMQYLLDHEDAKAYADKFLAEGKKSIMEYLGLEEEDICSAWVHYDENNLHCHLYYIPHVRERENILSEKDITEITELQKQMELSKNPTEFFEYRKQSYEEKIQRCEERLSTASPSQKKKIEKTLQGVHKDLDKLLSREGNEKLIKQYAQQNYRLFKSKMKAYGSETVKETVSVDKLITKDKLLKLHDKVSDDISQALGFRVEMRTGKSVGYDVQKATKEEKEAYLREKAARLQEEMLRESVKNATDIARAQADHIIKEAEEKAKTIIKEAEEEVLKIENQSDYDKGFEDAKKQFIKAVDDGVYVDGDKYRRLNEDFSKYTQDYNELWRKYNELEAGLNLEEELEE